MSGRGIAGRLVAAAVEFARGHGYRVRPACEYAEVWMARHPEHDDLRA
jgi:predicted GNAT family acetyltransferase